MNKDTQKVKGPMDQEKIFKVMMTMTFIVAGVFLLKNLIAQTFTGAIAIGICLGIFSLVSFVLQMMKVSQYVKQMALCVELPLLVFFISIFSGSYYSDDFPLFLAVVGLSGIYLEPVYTKIQMIEITVLLLLLYIIHPEKADPFSQYRLCVLLFLVAAYTFYMVIVRGRAFIEMSFEKTKEAEKLLTSIKNVGQELQENYKVSSERVNGMRDANVHLEENTTELKTGSSVISEGTQQIATACDEVQRYMQITESQIDGLNQEVKSVESAMGENQKNISSMDAQMLSVKRMVDMTQEVFAHLQEQILEISEITNQLTGIAANTKMLALNASIEAARAGETGAGFAVVASQVQSLAVDSNHCSEQVIRVVDHMKDQIEVTTKQLDGSVGAIDASLESLKGLRTGFDGLISNFDSLYSNIEEQNKNVQNVDSIFENLRDKILEVSAYSEENQAAVESIAESMVDYKEYMNKIVDDTKTIHELSASMLDISSEEDLT